MGQLVNKKGQAMFYALMLGIVIIVLTLALAGPVKERVDEARNTTIANGEPGLDCSNSTISDFNKATCVVADLTIFHFVGGLLFVAGAVIVAKIIF